MILSEIQAYERLLKYTGDEWLYLHLNLEDQLVVHSIQTGSPRLMFPLRSTDA
jgi:hypothetical protein